MKFKRVLIVSDLHCGHRVGLSPPEWWSSNCGAAYLPIQQETWKRYTDIVKNLGKIDILICNGDAIDGKGSKSAGTELIATSINTQREMAYKCIDKVGAKKIFFTHGTPYHTGAEDDETPLANDLGAEIRSHLFLNINGVNFDIKHEPAGKSQMPHTRPGAMGKDWLANLEWALDGEQPKADITIRSHVHYHAGCFKPGWLGLTTPALQGQGSKYGARRCSGRVHWGVIHFDVYEDGTYTWEPHIVIMESQRQESIKL